VQKGHLKELANGPVYWVDSADSQPCIGTGGVVSWLVTLHNHFQVNHCLRRSLKAKGKLGHSGFPHRSINAVKLVHHAIEEIQRRFHTDFAAHTKEKEYGFGSSSSLKPTRAVGTEGSLNQACTPLVCCVSEQRRSQGSPSCREIFA
jgi:acetylornithine deacetylase